MVKSLLSREAILAAEDRVVEEVEVPEWGGLVRVKGLSGTERDQFEASVAERKGKKTRMNLANIRARLVQRCVIGEDDKPLFKPNDVTALGAKSAAALDRVFEVAMRLSGMRDEDIEELTENLD